MKRLFTFFVAICATLSVFAVENVEITLTSDILSWGSGGDLWWQMNSVVDQSGTKWNLTVDPTMALPADRKYPWGTILTEDDMDWGYTELKRGYTKPSGDVTNMKVCAKLDASGNQMYEMVYDATYGAIDYHVHVVRNVPAGTSLFEGGSTPPNEEEDEAVADGSVAHPFIVEVDTEYPAGTAYSAAFFYQFTPVSNGTLTIETNSSMIYYNTGSVADLNDGRDYKNFASELSVVAGRTYNIEIDGLANTATFHFEASQEEPGGGGDSPSAEGSGTIGDPYIITIDAACPGGDNGGRYSPSINVYYKYYAERAGVLKYEYAAAGSNSVSLYYGSTCVSATTNFDDGIDVLAGTDYYFKLVLQGEITSITFHFTEGSLEMEAPELIGAVNNNTNVGETLKTFAQTTKLRFSKPCQYSGSGLKYLYNGVEYGQCSATISDGGYTATVRITGADAYLKESGEHTLTIAAGSFLTAEQSVGIAAGELTWTATGLANFSINTTDDGFASFCWDKNWEAPAGVTIYKAAAQETDMILIEAVSGVISAGEGVILYSSSHTPIVVEESEAETDALSGNILKGTTEEIARPVGTTYAMHCVAGTTYFDEYTGAKIPANKAYIQLDAGAPARLRVAMAGNTTTGMEAAATLNGGVSKRLVNGQLFILRDGKMYNVQGVKL